MDGNFPDENGIELTSDFKAAKPEVEIICLTGYGNIPDGVRGIKKGAFDYLAKSDDNNKVVPLVSKAMDKANLQLKPARIQSRNQQQMAFGNIIGKSNAIQEDIPELVDHFIAQFSANSGKQVSKADHSFIEALKKHNWKGNIRELRNVVERAGILANTDAHAPAGAQKAILQDLAGWHSL